MKRSLATDFDIMTSEEAGFESLFLHGPLWPCLMMASRGEAIIIAKQISLCCCQPTQFISVLASGNRIAISRQGGCVAI